MTTLHISPTPELSALAKSAFGYTGRKFAVTAAENFTFPDYVDPDNGGTWSDYAIVRGNMCFPIEYRRDTAWERHTHSIAPSLRRGKRG